MFLLQKNSSVDEIGAISFLLGILISGLLLNTAVLRFAADLIVNRMPKFKTAFFISFVCLFAGFIARLIVLLINKPQTNSVFETLSFSSQVISFLPLSVFLLVCWILNSKFLHDSDTKTVGYKNGLFITGLHIIFLMLIGLPIFAVFFFR